MYVKAGASGENRSPISKADVLIKQDRDTGRPTESITEGATARNPCGRQRRLQYVCCKSGEVTSTSGPGETTGPGVTSTFGGLLQHVWILDFGFRQSKITVIRCPVYTLCAGTTCSPSLPFLIEISSSHQFFPLCLSPSLGRRGCNPLRRRWS